jgi:hypothetical protein
MQRRNALILLSSAGATRRALASEHKIAVVTAAADAAVALSLDDLEQIFRRRKQFIGRTRAQPVNLPSAHALRRAFSQQVLRGTPEELEPYWRDQYFSGVFPPFVVASEEAVLRFVAATPGALGYVSACAVDKRVNVVLLLDGGPACTK